MKSTPSVKGFADYIKSIVAMYQKYNQSNYIYKILGKEEGKNGEKDRFIIQVAGKNIFPKFTADELMFDENMLKGFSPLDVRTITYFACKNHIHKENKTNERKGRSIFRVCMQAFSRIYKREMVVLEKVESSELITRTVQEVTRDKSIISGMSPADANRIGYIAGYEEASLEKDSGQNADKGGRG